MPKAKTSRKQLFRAALAIAGLTAAEWATSEGYSPEHLSRVLSREALGSATLIERIDAFTEEHLGKRGVKQVA